MAKSKKKLSESEQRRVKRSRTKLFGNIFRFLFLGIFISVLAVFLYAVRVYAVTHYPGRFS